jgi:hypothetical protein
MTVLPPADPDIIALGYDPVYFALLLYLAIGLMTIEWWWE